MSGNEIAYGKNSEILGQYLKLGRSIVVGDNVKITGKRISIEDNVIIGNNVKIVADDIFIGFNSKIDKNCEIIMSGADTEFRTGDNFYLGNDSRILSPVFRAGDYVALHNHALINGGSPCIIGHNFWAGQNCTLNSNEKLTIGNGVGIGTYSSVWTHGFFGEMLEGCNVFKVAPVTIEDDVWILGAYNVISPGIRLGKRSLVMTGSVVTKDVEPYHCVAGNPARDITEKVLPYRDVAIDEKYKFMKEYAQEFIKSRYPGAKQLKNGWSVEAGENIFKILFLDSVRDSEVNIEEIALIITKKDQTTSEFSGTSIFCLSSKKYTKRRTAQEIEFMRFLLSWRARFLPAKKD